MPGAIRRLSQVMGEETAWREKDLGIWQEITWSEAYGRVRDFSLGMTALGLERGDRVAIIGDNRPEWVIAELGAQAAGAIPVGIYQDSVLTELSHVLRKAAPKIVIAEDQEQVDKVLEAREAIGGIEAVVYYEPKGLFGYEAPGLMGFPEVEDLGRRLHEEDPARFDELVDALDEDDVALLCTTSGTTSEPKLAMLTHANLLAMARQYRHVDPVGPDDDYVSFLPLAWIGEQMLAVSAAVAVGFTVSFPEGTGTVRRDLREIGPRVLVSPPRIWENLLSDVQVMAEDTTPLKRRVYRWGLGVGRRLSEARFEGRAPGWVDRALGRVAEWVVLGPIKDQLGLRRVRRAYTGGAALGPDIFRYFHALGVNLKQLYGQTEASGIWVVHRDDDIRFHTVGTPFPEMELRVSDRGEILCRGPSVFRGYFENEEATRKALHGGWLHSGDAGYLEEDGHLVVVDRLGDVMLLPDGTTFSPQFVENKLKFSPYIREAVVFGGGDHPYVTAAIAIDFENAGQWAERRQIAYTTFTDLAQKGPVRALCRAHVSEVNQDLPESARIRRFLLLHKELHADDAELTRTRKVRRGFIAERFSDLVDALYGSDDSVTVETEITYQDGRTAVVKHPLAIEGL